jgi:hypothetical protein
VAAFGRFVAPGAEAGEFKLVGDVFEFVGFLDFGVEEIPVALSDINGAVAGYAAKVVAVAVAKRGEGIPGFFVAEYVSFKDAGAVEVAKVAVDGGLVAVCSECVRDGFQALGCVFCFEKAQYVDARGSDFEAFFAQQAFKVSDVLPCGHQDLTSRCMVRRRRKGLYFFFSIFSWEVRLFRVLK